MFRQLSGALFNERNERFCTTQPGALRIEIISRPKLCG
jgi:hypothetical protein